MKLEPRQPNAGIRRVLHDALVTVGSVQWYGSETRELAHKILTGKVANDLLYRLDELRLKLLKQRRPWSLDGDGLLFRLLPEPPGIRLAHLFAPMLAVHRPVVEPLPYQAAAVYEAMLPRQRLCSLLARRGELAMNLVGGPSMQVTLTDVATGQ